MNRGKVDSFLFSPLAFDAPLKSILRRHFPDSFNKRIKSRVNSFLPKGDGYNKSSGKKCVHFAPGTVMVERESKPYNRMLPKPRSPAMPDLFSGLTFLSSSDGELTEQQSRPPSTNMNTPVTSNLISTIVPTTRSLSLPLPQSSSSSPSPSSSIGLQPTPPETIASTSPAAQKVTNEYTRFTLAKRTPDHALHTEMDRLPTRVKRLFENIENLQVAHVAYNSLPSTQVREKFLLDQVIRRQIVSLEISMSEGLIHFAMDVIDTMYEATQFIRSLYYNDFYHPDGSHTLLPIIMNNEQDDYINKLAPVVYSLNRISGDRRRSDNTCMNIETVCTKLQLEMISLTISPAKSLMFRSILEVVPSTALTARQLLEEVEDKSCVKWVNNSLMRKDYTKILLSFNLIDKQDIVTKFPVMKKSNKKAPSSNNKLKEKKGTTTKTSNIIVANGAEKGDVYLHDHLLPS